MALNTIIEQGKITSNGSDVLLILRQDVDWAKVYNYTQAAAATSGRGVYHLWFKGMSDGDGLCAYHASASNALSMKPHSSLSARGFYYQNTSDDPVGDLNTTVTAISNASIPIVSLTDTTGLNANDVVRFINVTGAQQLGGIDFTIDTIVANTSFRLPYMAQIAAATTGSFRKIKYGATYQPQTRYISKITKASSAVVTMTVAHEYQTGQQVRLVVPSDYGMTQMNGLTGTITATTTSTITLDIDSSGFSTFSFPTTGAGAFTPAHVVPFGREADITYNNSTNGAVDDEAEIRLRLGSGDYGPAGNSSDVLYWIAGKGFSIGE